MLPSMLLTIVLIATALLVAGFLLAPRVRNNRDWQATVTPLASIIGSGFLVIVPLLGNSVGGYAPLAITGIVGLAYWIGAAIRFNIRFSEAPTKQNSSDFLHRINGISSISLAIAYFISVTFYLRLLASFAMQGIHCQNEFYAKLTTTAILLFIGTIGWFRGLSLLEKLEEYSVSIKLAIIASLLVGWAVYDASHLAALDTNTLFPDDLDAWQITRLLAGVLIVVQGFETSRYLGDQYDAATCISTMRRAQIISGVIYILFVLLTVPTFGFLTGEVKDTAIIDLSRVVSPALPIMLVIAALMSQFSAAIADTVGAGGLLTESLGARMRFSPKFSYLIVAGIGTLLVWTTNIFEIISLASRAFAIYYAIQCIIAATTARRVLQGRQRSLQTLSFVTLSVILIITAIIAIPAG